MAVSTDGTNNHRTKGNTFGDLVREIRRSKDWTQGFVAKRAGMSPGYVGLIETGERGDRPKLDMVKRLAQALGTNVEETEALMRAAGHLGPNEELIDGKRPTTLSMIEADPRLTDYQKSVVAAVYRAYLPDA